MARVSEGVFGNISVFAPALNLCRGNPISVETDVNKEIESLIIKKVIVSEKKIHKI